MGTFSRLIEIDPYAELTMEQPAQEFVYNFLDDLPHVKVGEIIIDGIEIKPGPDTFLMEINLNLSLKPRSIMSLQAQDAKFKMILKRLEVGGLDANVYLIEDGILMRRLAEQTGNEFKTIFLPKSMVDHVLITAHDHSGHNRFPRMYAAIRCLCFLVGMKKDIHQHCKRCQLCAKHDIAKVNFKKAHFRGA